MIYRFLKPILLPDGVVIPAGDPIILDDPDANDPVALAVKAALESGEEVKPPKNKKDKTPQ